MSVASVANRAVIEARFALRLVDEISRPYSCIPRSNSVYDLPQLRGTNESSPVERLAQSVLSLLHFHPFVSYVIIYIRFSVKEEW